MFSNTDAMLMHTWSSQIVVAMAHARYAHEAVNETLSNNHLLMILVSMLQYSSRVH